MIHRNEKIKTLIGAGVLPSEADRYLEEATSTPWPPEIENNVTAALEGWEGADMYWMNWAAEHPEWVFLGKILDAEQIEDNG